jgi:DNA-binding MarR family transcriptional regulator
MRLTELSPIELDIIRRVSGLPIDRSAMTVMSNVWRTARGFELRMERRVLRPNGLTFAAFNTLFIVWIWAPVETRQIARLSGVTRATVTSTVTKLERQGLVTRHGSEGDGRLVLVKLTRKGKGMIERIFPEFNKDEQSIASSLTVKEQDTLTSLLRKVQRAVGGDSAAEWPDIA